MDGERRRKKKKGCGSSLNFLSVPFLPVVKEGRKSVPLTTFLLKTKVLNGNIVSEKEVHRQQRVSRSDGAIQMDYMVILLVTWMLGVMVLKPLALFTTTEAACRLNSASLGTQHV